MLSFKRNIFIGDTGCILSLCWLLITVNIQAQVPKPPVTRVDYHLWGTLYTDRISNKGGWVSYVMDYDNATDTLFVARTDRNKRYKLSGGSSGRFSGEEVFAYTNSEGVLTMLDLRSGKNTTITKVLEYGFAAEGKYLITLSANSLEIRDKKGGIVRMYKGIEGYKSGRDDTVLLCVQNNGNKERVILIDLLKDIKETEVLEPMEGKISNLVWHKEEHTLAFLQENGTEKNNDIYYYSFPDKKLHHLDSNSGIFPKGFHIENSNITRLSISETGNTLLFVIKRDERFVPDPDGVQQWNTNDPILVPERYYNTDIEHNIRLAAWMPETGKVVLLTTDETPLGVVTPDYRYALTYTPEDSQPQYVLNPVVNYHVKKIATGGYIGTLHDMPTDIGSGIFSPAGKYFTYCKDNAWIAYDFKQQQYISLTKGLGLGPITNKNENREGNYSIAAWGPADAYLLVYDAYDIWKVSLKGENPKRLTQGREKNISYRIVPPAHVSRQNFSGHTVPSIDLRENLLISVTSNNDTGYALLKPTGTLVPIVWQNAMTSGIVKAADAEVYIYESQNYDSPPSLSTYKEGKSQMVFQSNSHHTDFAWGKQEIISYRNSKNTTLHGILYYPANYDPAKKYPMVVNIYEKQLYMQHYYFNPSEQNMAAFNASNLTAQGYFVLMPDIEYELGNPGISALDCVTAATEVVINTGLVAPDKIALMGTSFGGYETNFIMTRTNLFCTAITGASVFDLQSWYLSIGNATRKAEIWRYESQQWRMEKSLFEDRQAYVDNSPASFVEHINAPMLIWAGENDRTIDPHQSIALYLALRRLNKKGVMLLYPKEGHSLVMPNNQTDLTRKVEDWLAFFLKGEPASGWIVQATK